MTDQDKAEHAQPAQDAKERPAAPAPDIASLSRLARADSDCEDIENLVNLINRFRCGAKANVLPHAGGHTHTGCRCTGGGNSLFLADLIVLIDTSSSMNEEADAVSNAAAAAVEAAKAACNVDLRIAYMGVEGTWPGTAFTVDYLAYLKGILNPDPVFETDSPPGGYPGEEGANAIEDLSKYYDWRPDACRAIFYISDEELDSCLPTIGDTANEALQVSKAVAAANANHVTVFAHHITNLNRGPAVIQNYNDLCNQTGGQAFFSNAASAAEYERILAEAICGACGKPRCEEAEIPALEPCIGISWGDSKCDCFETDDTEIICVTVCNCYSNVTFSNFEIAAIYVTTPGGGAVPTLPDGTSSVQVTPLGPICFGDIPPCRDDEAGCVSREVVVRTRGAKGGKYEIRMVGICYEVTSHYNKQDIFELTLCQD